MVEVRRTIKRRLNPSPEQVALFVETRRMYTLAYNAAAAWGWENRESNRFEIQKVFYKPYRKANPALRSQLLCSAIKKASESLKSAFALMEKHKAAPKRNPKPSCPQSDVQAIRYNSGRSYRLRDSTVSLTVVGAKPVILPFSIPEGQAHYRDWTTECADLLQDRQGRWWLHVSLTKPVEFPESEAEPKVLGVDLGLTIPAMDSDGQSYGDPNWRLIEERYAKHRARWQAKGTKSAKRRLKATSGRQKRFRHDCDHVLSKRIVSKLSPGDVVVLEDLTCIRDRVKMRKAQATRVHQWSFAQIQTFTKYKAEGKGATLALIDPRYTSQTCNECGHRDKKNRKRQADFLCVKCGHAANADHNAAKNIRDKYILGLPVNQPIAPETQGSAPSGEAQAPVFRRKGR